jgi:DNA-binding NarL/FixJ family response regulator
MGAQGSRVREVRYRRALIARASERAELELALRRAADGEGGLVLLAGEAGVGKTHLAEDVLAGSDALVLSAAAAPDASAPYGPIAAVLRAFLQLVPNGFRSCGPAGRYLGLLLPELEPAPDPGDRATLFEAIRCAFAAIARPGPTAVFLDDLQWADEATLELLPTLTSSVEPEPLFLLGAYRSDEIPRGHSLRRMRMGLRRAGRLHELALEPLGREDSAALVTQVLGHPASDPLLAALYDRTQGVPFFLEELAEALAAGGRLREGPAGVELAPGFEVPIPETVRDAVLLRTQSLSEGALRALDLAAVAGLRLELELLVAVTGEAGISELLDRGLLLEEKPGVASFRHALAREALYAAVPWSRRRALHRQLAAELERRTAAPVTIAEHWFAGGEAERCRGALLAAAEGFWRVHAHGDAARVTRRALELWPEGEDERGRLAVLARLGECAVLSGDFDEATAAWREALDSSRRARDLRTVAELERRLAGLYELQCAWDGAFASRRAAAEAFQASGQPGEAAAERIAAAGNLQSAGSHGAALELIRSASEEAERAKRPDLKARALGLEGLVRARMGEFEAGLDAARAGLSLALAENLIEPAAETYEKVGMILDLGANHSGAIDAFTTAFDFCETHGVSGRAKTCLGCLAYVLRKTGEWDRAVEICRDVIAFAEAPRNARCAAIGELGLIHALRGDTKRARTRLAEALALAQQTEFMIMKLDAAWGLARVDEQQAEYDSAGRRCHLLLEFAREGEDSHYPVPALRWATTFFACRGIESEAGACAEVLGRIGGQTGNPEALAAIAHALGELALLNGNAEQAARQFGQALQLLHELELPLERAETQLRAGVSLAAAGEREAAIERLTDAFWTARKLGARPLASRARTELSQLGERADRRLARGGAATLEHGGLTRRELEVIRLVAVGRTNREIAQELFVSPRTVDMHVRNTLTKLGCRSRTDATRKAGELGLLI